MELMVYINKTEFSDSLSKKLSWVSKKAFSHFISNSGGTSSSSETYFPFLLYLKLIKVNDVILMFIHIQRLIEPTGISI